MLSAQTTILWSRQQDPEMDKVLPARQKTASGTRRCTIILCGCPIDTTPRYALGPPFFLDIYQQPTWCGPTLQCQTFLQTAFCTEELKTNMTRPYFNKTLTLSENGITCGKWNLTQANTMSSASCPTSKEKSWHPATSSTGNTGNNKCQQVPGHHHQQWSVLVYLCWGYSSMRKWDSGVPVKQLQGVYSKSKRPKPQWYALHWSMLWLSEIPTSKRTSDCWKKLNTGQPGMYPTTTWTEHLALLHPCLNT